MQESNNDSLSAVLQWIKQPIINSSVTYNNPQLTFKSVQPTKSGWIAQFTTNKKD